jgi:hypothetical protein
VHEARVFLRTNFNNNAIPLKTGADWIDIDTDNICPGKICSPDIQRETTRNTNFDEIDRLITPGREQLLIVPQIVL